ncbi:cation:dicarboxylase symporter family transporter, partial [Geodermatophilus sp. DF01_2]|uniref:cation:dicarboxylate symporter family transporter n=1 Tax=Geodermatophilus sp. DF01-2 TaxID=2559610 RepID=UPI0024763692
MCWTGAAGRTRTGGSSSAASSETALPRLIAKMEHAGVSQPVAGIVVPTGYSFNLDGTAIYL